MKQLKYFSVTLVVMLFVPQSPAAAKALEGPAQVTFAGTSVDADGDGFPGLIVSGSTDKSIGKSIDGLADVVFSGFNTARCPGVVDNTITAFPLVLADKHANQIWAVLVSGFLCFDNATGGIPTFDAVFLIAGGTGSFEGASGSIHLEGSGAGLAADFSTSPPRFGFGALAGSVQIDLD